MKMKKQERPKGRVAFTDGSGATPSTMAVDARPAPYDVYRGPPINNPSPPGAVFVCHDETNLRSPR